MMCHWTIKLTSTENHSSLEWSKIKKKKELATLNNYFYLKIACNMQDFYKSHICKRLEDVIRSVLYFTKI